MTSMRGIILRHDADELIIKPNDADVERFGVGTPVATTRYYGSGMTIHQTGHVDVETWDGMVVSVWFRCQPLPFQQTVLDHDGAKTIPYPGDIAQHRGYSRFPNRAQDMIRMYSEIKERPDVFSLAGVYMEK